jgi:SAM-dependent methyltransferase
MPSAIFNIYSPEEQWSRFWKEKSLEREVKLCESRQLRTYLLDVLGQMEDPLVLEAGCGMGAWVAYLSRIGIRRVIGLDNYGLALRQLKELAPDCLVVEADIRSLPFEDNSLDACISLGVVEHFRNGPASLIQEMYRVLRPSGYLFLTVPYYNLFRRCFVHPLRAWYLNVKSRIRKSKLHFVEYRFSVGELERIVRDCGFELAKVATDEYESPKLALGLHADLPLLRGCQDGSLNSLGRIVRWSATRINPWLIAGGVFLLARKPAVAVTKRRAVA